MSTLRSVGHLGTCLIELHLDYSVFDLGLDTAAMGGLQLKPTINGSPTNSLLISFDYLATRRSA